MNFGNIAKKFRTEKVTPVELNGNNHYALDKVENGETPKSDTHHDVLAALDDQKFSLYHIKAILVSGVGFLTDAYDLFSINLAVPMIGYVYYDGHMPTLSDACIKGAATIGTLIGQIVFGILADILGRKKMYGVVLEMMVIGTFCSALSANTVRGINVVHMLVFWRFLLGIGIGGDYPLSAVITSEYANVQRRGQMMAAVFAMQGCGILLAAIVAIVLLACFKQLILEDPLYLDYVWRILLGVGIIPAVVAVYFRYTLAETPRYTMQVKGNLQKAARDVSKAQRRESLTVSSTVTETKQVKAKRASFKDFVHHFGQWKYFKVLFGCAATWFCLDIAFYGLQLNQYDVLHSMGYVPDNGTVFEKMYNNAAGNAIISLMGTIPGYWFTVALIEKMGRVKIQYMGFIVLTSVFVILCAAYYPIKEQPIALFIFIYCVGLFFFNFGPNVTTFIIPGEVFPTRYRSTGHGISAASGKLGAFIASIATPFMAKQHGIQMVLGVFAGFMFIGTVCTYFVPETKAKTLEELAGDEQLQTEIGKENKSSKF